VIEICASSSLVVKKFRCYICQCFCISFCNTSTFEIMRAHFVFAARNFAAQKGFVNSTCYANIVTVKKMLSLIEEHNKVARPKIGLSAIGLTGYAKKVGVTGGWESGSLFSFQNAKVHIEKWFSREIYKVHATCEWYFPRGYGAAAS
jgi:hypothetical protein